MLLDTSPPALAAGSEAGILYELERALRELGVDGSVFSVLKQDVRKAFDSVWLSPVLRVLRRCGAPAGAAYA